MSDTRYAIATDIKSTECVIAIEPTRYDENGNTVLLTDDELNLSTVCKEVVSTVYLSDIARAGYHGKVTPVYTYDKRNALFMSSYYDAVGLKLKCDANSKHINRVVLK